MRALTADKLENAKEVDDEEDDRDFPSGEESKSEVDKVEKEDFVQSDMAPKVKAITKGMKKVSILKKKPLTASTNRFCLNFTFPYMKYLYVEENRKTILVDFLCF